MSLHHLDPRQAGTGAAPDVEIDSIAGMFWWVDSAGRHHPFDTEAAALAAARAAAGFGHVAERACATEGVCVSCSSVEAAERHKDCPHCKDNFTCDACAWPRDAHQVQA